tara:strand:+ start:358 stop:615 length:258 start_codon:yes stop_codon:yes gene_type:complete
MILRVGDWVLLKGTSRHGKNRVDQHGDVWEVVATEGPRDGVALRSKNKTFNTGGTGDNKWIHDGRWIDQPTDNDFEILKKLDIGI